MYVRLGRYAKEDEENFVRDEDIVIHPYDTWSMDYTLALLIVPLLKQLKETKHGAPDVDCIDVPMRLQPKQMDVVRYREEGITDDNFFKRWDYVIDEMIWAFEQIVDEDNENQFWNGKDLDKEGLEKHHKRINNGTKLFGKYFRSLWD